MTVQEGEAAAMVAGRVCEVLVLWLALALDCSCS